MISTSSILTLIQVVWVVLLTMQYLVHIPLCNGSDLDSIVPSKQYYLDGVMVPILGMQVDQIDRRGRQPLSPVVVLWLQVDPTNLTGPSPRKTISLLLLVSFLLPKRHGWIREKCALISTMYFMDVRNFHVAQKKNKIKKAWDRQDTMGTWNVPYGNNTI